MKNVAIKVLGPPVTTWPDLVDSGKSLHQRPSWSGPNPVAACCLIADEQGAAWSIPESSRAAVISFICVAPIQKFSLPRGRLPGVFRVKQPH